MKSAQECINDLASIYRPSSLPAHEWQAVSAICNRKQIEAIQTDARADLQKELDDAVELLRETKPRQRYDKNWDEWKQRRDAFLSRHRKE